MIPYVLAVALLNFQGSLSPAQIKIQAARQSVAAQPENFEAFNDLAAAYNQRFLETDNPSDLTPAEDALNQSLSLSPHNFQGERAKLSLLLSRHEYSSAKDAALTLFHRTPDDVITRGYLSDAEMGLGDYEASVDAAQGMLTLRSDNLGGLERGAILREIFGSVDGALELWQKVYERTSPIELEERAHILSAMSHLNLIKGDLQRAQENAEEALRIFPNYYAGIRSLAAVRLAQGRYAGAVELDHQLCSLVPRASSFYLLADALNRANRKPEARQAFMKFTQVADEEAQTADNANLDLVLYDVDIAHKPVDALALAKQEYALRRDVFTLDAYTWALWANGDKEEARKVIAMTLSIGVKEPAVLYHVGAIEIGLGEKEAGLAHLREAAAGSSLDARSLLEKLHAAVK